MPSSGANKSEGDSSFAIIHENKSPSDEQNFVGYYDSNNISIHSAKSSTLGEARGKLH
jgi:hypothetical protein